ncbi:TPA: carboxymuconolactone decarboxylase family protein, partial [Klebsiella pneumoniae]|nr:carboxymuconolactone decarboxylase family protein [Klebsiella pneumoniae]
PDQVAVSRLQTFTAYDRLSTALTVAQVYGVQRLCNHYAARLAPLPGPDSSRESNRRLAQITQYARQLAGSPSVINALSRSQLDEVGLTSRDIILFNQIIGFVGFQARAIAVLQAAQGFPVRWIPGMPQQEEAPAELFAPPPGAWQADIADPDLQYADDERQRRIAGWQSLPGLDELAPLLACDPQLFAPLETLIRQLSTDDTFGPQVALLTARTNGSPTCFDAWLPHWQGEEEFASHLREGDQALHHWLQQHPQARSLVTAVQLLTRSPDRFSAAQLTPLAEYRLSEQQAIDLLIWSGLCGWMNRLKIALGNVRQQT